MKKVCCGTLDQQLEGARLGKQFDDSDWIINYIPKFNEYGIIIHDGGTSSYTIKFCPWCGTKLPDSKRDEWFDKLEALGFDDPGEEDIPEEFDSDRWYREKS